MCHECDDGVFVCVMSVMMVCMCRECDDGVFVCVMSVMMVCLYVS